MGGALAAALSAGASFIAGLIGTTLFAGSAIAQAIVLTNASLIDGSGTALQRGVTIVMDGGRIVDMGGSVRAPAGSSVIDLSGKYVVPGIINGHGHVGAALRDPQLRQYARHGVTTTTSMSFDQDDIQQFKAAQKAGDLRGARILTVMYRFMSEPFKPGSENKTPEEARAKVDEIVAKGADFIKVWIDAQGGRYSKLTPEFTAAVMDQATRHNKIKMAHIVELEDARRIVDQGVNVLAHDVRDQDIPDDFIATLRRKNVAVISTLAREEAMFASLIGRLGSSTFRLSTPAVSMSLTGSCFSSESAPRPFHHGSRERGGTIFRAALLSDERQVQATKRTHLIHRPARDIFPP